MSAFYAAIKDSFRIQSLLGALLLLGLVIAPPVTLAQEEGAEAEEEITSDEVPADEDEAVPLAVPPTIEEVVVTGSRLRRDTFSSIAPLQIITGQISREAGLMDAAAILQESTSASGQQIDLTFQGFVLDNGPGASTINLRGLSDDRSLILINGRRVAPSGVEGAPSSPDLNLVPASLVAQYEILLDGASSVYGSDAVAGVVNAVMRKDFDGFEIESFSSFPYHGAGDGHTLTLSWGKNFDRGFVGVGAEYSDSEAVTFADRPWTEGCTKHAEIDENGRIRTDELFWPTRYNMRWDECAGGGIARRIRVPFASDIYPTPGTSNGGWPNFSDPFIFRSLRGTTLRYGVDSDGDGQADLSNRDFELNGKEQFAYLYPEVTQSSVMAYGEYTFEGEMNLTPYFEVLWSERDYFSNSGAGQFFPVVPANNPFNICNPEAEGGVDCGLANDLLLVSPGYVQKFQSTYSALCAQFGISLQDCTHANLLGLNGPEGPRSTQPIVSIRGDRNTTDVLVSHTRFVGGVSGDLPFLNLATLNDWSFDLSLSHSASEGSSRRRGIREDRFELAIGDYSSTSTPCENDLGVELASDAAPGCVPVNMFAPSLYPEEVVGDFATSAERDYVIGNRDFDTEYEQTLATFFMSGDLYQLPAGAIAGGIGVEWRKDKIISIPDHVARDGLFWGFFSDGGAEGDKITKELFAEIELPLLAGAPLAEELTLNLSTRLTDDEYYGQAWTESFKLAYRPFNSLLIRATYGTSYRAPNLRELFLRDQTGFSTLFDPCFVPAQAYDDLTEMYVASEDTREPHVLENCRANGVDPTLAYANGQRNFSTEIAAGGVLDINEETSESQTVGFSWEQPFTNEFHLGVSATLYEIEVIDTIIEPSAQFIINDCYYSETGNSPFCSRIVRNLSDPTNPRFDIIRQGFINRDSEKVKGVDVNATFTDTYTVLDRPVNLLVDLAAHRLLERSTLFVDDEGVEDFNEFQGEWYFPYWKFQLAVRLDYDRWRLSWQANYIDGQKSDPRFQDEFGDISDRSSDACLGPPDDVLCKDIDWISDYMQHSVSLFYRADSWRVGAGVRNVFDESPPFVQEGPATFSNTPLGVGYNLNGRSFFLNLEVSFGGGE